MIKDYLAFLSEWLKCVAFGMSEGLVSMSWEMNDEFHFRYVVLKGTRKMFMCK